MRSPPLPSCFVMKKILGVIVLVAVGGLFAYRFWSAPVRIAPAAAPLAAPPHVADAPPPAIHFTPVEPTAKPTPKPIVQATSSGYPPMDLPRFLGPNNQYHDPVFGVSATYPEGWSVKQGMRWGTDNRQNTIFFSPPEGNHAVPSM
jgi:hypothetical protein